MKACTIRLFRMRGNILDERFSGGIEITLPQYSAGWAHLLVPVHTHCIESLWVYAEPHRARRVMRQAPIGEFWKILTEYTE